MVRVSLRLHSSLFLSLHHMSSACQVSPDAERDLMDAAEYHQVNRLFFAGYHNMSNIATCTMSTVSAPTAFRIPALNDLTIGRALAILPEGSKGPTMVAGQGWNIPTGLYTARQIVQACAPLLETVLHHLGRDAPSGPTARDMLLDNLASNLALNTRESSLQLHATDAGRVEVAAQAIKIGKSLVGYAREAHEVAYDPAYVVRSPCEGHLLKEKVAQLMFGPQSRSHLMQIYNEYLHQMVLLRDALLPFDNYQDLVIPIVQRKRPLGLRFIESTRTLFLAELLTKAITQKTMFKLAQNLLLPESQSSAGFALQYRGGLIVPGFLNGSKSTRLLSYLPAQLDVGRDVVFESKIEDYFSAPRSELTVHPSPSGELRVLNACSLAATSPEEESNPGIQHLALQLDFGQRQHALVDLGQIARGRRYAYDIRSEKAVLPGTSDMPMQNHTQWDVLADTSDGLITAKDVGVHFITADSPVMLLAIIGRLYPENIIIIGAHQSARDALQQGKALSDGPRFVVQLKEA